MAEYKNQSGSIPNASDTASEHCSNLSETSSETMNQEFPGDTTQHSSDVIRGEKEKTRQAAEQVRSTMHDTAQELRHKTGEAAQEAKAAAREMKDHAVQSATQTARKIQDQAAGYAHDQKGRIAAELGTFGDAMARAADKFREEDDRNVAGYADMAARQLRSAADYLRERDVSDLLGDAENFARRRPEVFFGGMLLVGLGIARFLKASRPTRYQQNDRQAASRNLSTDSYDWNNETASSHDASLGRSPTSSAYAESNAWPAANTSVGQQSASNPTFPE